MAGNKRALKEDGPNLSNMESQSPQSSSGQTTPPGFESARPMTQEAEVVQDSQQDFASEDPVPENEDKGSDDRGLYPLTKLMLRARHTP